MQQPARDLRIGRIARYSEVLRVNQPETSCERPPNSSCRGFRGSSGGRRFEDDALICLRDFPVPALELIVTRPWAAERGAGHPICDGMNPLAFSRRPLEPIEISGQTAT